MENRPHHPDCFCYRCEEWDRTTACAEKEEAEARRSEAAGSPSSDVRRCGEVTISRNGYIEEIEHQRDEALRAATYTHTGCTASAMGWAIKYANIHELASRLAQAKGRFHTQKAFEDLREFISSENASAMAPPPQRLPSTKDVPAVG